MPCDDETGGHLCLRFLLRLKDLLDLVDLFWADALLIPSGFRAAALSRLDCLTSLTRSAL